MIKKKFSKLGDIGSMMIEALAMLGLISMVTPIVYKKAAERNTELQDINAASQMRNLVRAVDEYVMSNYGRIAGGEIVKNNCAESEINYRGLSSATHIDVPIAHLCDYLPYGFLKDDGSVEENKIFSENYRIVIKEVEIPDSNNKKTLTGFIVASPKQGEDFPRIRASRISAMIGGNGGYVLEDAALGVQGMWGVEDIGGELGLTGIEDGAIIASSVHPISSGSGDKDEDVLYRKYQDDRTLNTMETTLLMGDQAATGQSIDYVNQIVVYGATPSAFADKTVGAEGALLLKDGAGAMIDGVLSVAENRFRVTTGGSFGIYKTETGPETTFEVGADGSMKAADGKFAINPDGSFAAAGGNFGVDASGNVAAKGNAVIEKDLAVRGSTVLGAGAAQSGYTLTVNGNAIITGALRVLGAFKANAIDTGKLRAGTANVDSNNDSDYTLVTDATQLKVGVDRFSVQRATGNTKIQGGNLLVTANDGTTQDFLADGTSGYTYARNFRAGGVSGDTEFPLEVLETGNINVNLKGTANSFLGYDAANNEMLRFDNTVSRIQKGTAAAYGRVNVENNNVTVSAQSNATTASSVRLDNNNIDMRVNPSTVNPDVKISRQGATNESNITVNNNRRMEVYDKDNKKVLYVDTVGTDKNVTITDRTTAGSKGGVYIRRGVIDLETNNETNYAAPGFKTDKDKGFVRADMLVSQKVSGVMNSAGASTANALAGNVRSGATGTQYDMYMVNPAYTSVMHDIKLTTRGGARLSDILPDFINKGIYIVDNTYPETGTIWPSASDVTAPSGGSVTVSGYSECSSNLCSTSPFVGVVPTPQCPPGYQKVIQVIPYGFNIAQAGLPGGASRSDRLFTWTNPVEQIPDPASGKNPSPLYFQKSTWLRTRVRTEGTEDTFKGWSVLLGFIYPSLPYTNIWGSSQYHPDSNNYIWNLFPVYYRELEAYANVYCYFKRTNFDSSIVDTDYDQLNRFRTPFNKGDTGFTKRLNDPNMNYTNPW